MNRENQGHYVTITTLGQKKIRSFIPAHLPPMPPIEWAPELHDKFDKALLALGRLDSLSSMLQDISFFLYMHVRQEAIISSSIEGTQSSLVDLLLFEVDQIPRVPLDDVKEVSRYIAALEHGLRLLEGGLPLSLRLIREVHRVLLSDGRGCNMSPGEFRRIQNWIGGKQPENAVFVPPPPNEVLSCMANLEMFLNNQPSVTPSLVKAALAHVQFESIHPFLDGNGRLGRLLITLLLCVEKVLNKPLLYLSLYFKNHRDRYYTLINNVRLKGDWEAWLDFFADGVIYTANKAHETILALVELTNHDLDRISALGRATASTLSIYRAMLEQPIATYATLVKKTGISSKTIFKSLNLLMKLGIAEELTKGKRNRLFSYSRYIEIIHKGADHQN
ncbi:MAG: Fic family protein [Deltaproteobacteria bacterium]|nr:Fic family protein [Deltaproteobacteria bacterium]